MDKVLSELHADSILLERIVNKTEERSVSIP